MSRIRDISLRLTEALAVWPGDEPFRRTVTESLDAGGAINLSAFSMSVHAGTHADAPSHFLPDGITAGELPLDAYAGPAVVVDARGRDALDPDLLHGIDLAASPRVLFRTEAWTDHTLFPASVPVLALDTVAALATAGAVLVGLDVPSVDALDSKDLPVHHALARAGIHILESLDLSDVPPGRYTLAAAPLPIQRADGAPVRAILLEEA